MTMRVKIARFMPSVLMMLAGHFFLTSLVPMPVLIQIPWFVAGVIVMWAWLFLRHCLLLCD